MFKRAVFALFLLLFAVLSPAQVWGSSYQKCAVNSSCVLGEFLYDDSYVPITNAVCTINGRDPDNAVFLNNQNAPHVNDGWYAKTVSTTGLSVGIYPTKLCCVTGGQTLCIDKTFSIDEPDLTQSSVDNAVTSIKGGANLDITQVATSVAMVQTSVNNAVTSIKGASNKDLSEVSTDVGGVKTTVDSISSAMGTLVADIWSNSTNSFNTLVNSIWTNPTRELTSANITGGQIATASGVASAVTSIKGASNKDLSEVSGQVAGVQTSVDSMSVVVNNLSLQVSTVSAKADTLLGKWGTYSIADIVSGLSTITNNIGNIGDTCLSGNTIMARSQCLIDKWGSQTAGSVYSAAVNAQSAAESLRTELDYNGKSTTAYQDIQTLNTNLNLVSGLLGSSSDSALTATIFGRIKKVEDNVESLNTSGTGLTNLLAKWGDYSAADIFDKVKDLSSQISAVNTVDNVSAILNKVDTSANDLEQLKNTVLSLKALVSVNQQLLEKTANKPIVQSWLEEGSIIFKNLITNPSTTTRQSVSLKFYLPREATQKDIMVVDPGLSVVYDPSQDALEVSGEFDLDPKETKIVSVEVTDVWKIEDSEINALKNQETELFEPLKGTAYFAQGTTLKSDIEVSLEKISRLQRDAKTPEARILAYREGEAELTKVNGEINDLKTLVTSLSSNKSMFGFVGGSQLLSVWGMVMVMVAGFVFLGLLIKKVSSTKEKPTEMAVFDKLTVATSKKLSAEILAVVVLLVVMAVGMVGYYFLIRKDDGISDKAGSLVVPTETPIPSPTATIIPTPTPTIMVEQKEINLNSPKQVLGISTDEPTKSVVTASEITIINVRSKPSLTASIIMKVKVGVVLQKVSERGDWIEVKISALKEGILYKTGWINKSLLIGS